MEPIPYTPKYNPGVVVVNVHCQCGENFHFSIRVPHSEEYLEKVTCTCKRRYYPHIYTENGVEMLHIQEEEVKIYKF